MEYKLTSNYVLYFDGKAEILKTGQVFKLAGIELSKCTSKSPFHYNDEIIRLSNCILEIVRVQ
jgi:hypothetical protein